MSDAERTGANPEPEPEPEDTDTDAPERVFDPADPTDRRSLPDDGQPERR